MTIILAILLAFAVLFMIASFDRVNKIRNKADDLLQLYVQSRAYQHGFKDGLSEHNNVPDKDSILEFIDSLYK